MNTTKPSLHTTVVHGGDNVMCARSAAVELVMKTARSKTVDIFEAKTDMLMIFSWAHTMGKDKPSEARKMYDIFAKRLKVLDAGKKINGSISLPDDTSGLRNWKIRVWSRNVEIHLEEASVDTEDNAEKSMQIIHQLVQNKGYEKVLIAPLSSDFHTKRIGQAFTRNTPKDLPVEITPISAEQSLEAFWGKYLTYGQLKKTAIPPKTKLLEVALQTVSHFEAGRTWIRGTTQKRMES